MNPDNEHIDQETHSVVLALMNAVASSASIERVFSTFGLVHSKIKNRLGVEKASKLVFLHRTMNRDKFFCSVLMDIDLID